MFWVMRAETMDMGPNMVSAYADLDEDKKCDILYYIFDSMMWVWEFSYRRPKLERVISTIRNGAINRGILSGILRRISSFVTLLFERGFELNKNLHLFP